jgi:UDP-N-acetylmuramate dehydrogenase
MEPLQYNGGMQLTFDVPLAPLTTMRLGGNAKAFCVLTTEDDLTQAVAWAQENNLPMFMLGGGSNIIMGDGGFEGLVMKNEIMGFDLQSQGAGVRDQGLDEGQVSITVGAGEIWDSFVERTVALGLTGVEALSLIPGTVGATPVQNVGAYGQEVSQTIVELKAYDTKRDEFVVLSSNDCEFGYRDSRFKEREHGRFFITSVTFTLHKGQLQPPYYKALEQYMAEHNIADYSPASVRAAVIAVRQSKLPDPTEVANTGSFFKNPIVSATMFEDIKQNYPEAPGWPLDDGTVKIPAGWLLETAGYKGYKHNNGMGMYEKHALVMVNYSASSFADLAEFKDEVCSKVQDMFGVMLAVEPEIIR